MAKKKENMKKRYRKGGPARLDMRKGGRVALGGGGGSGTEGTEEIEDVTIAQKEKSGDKNKKKGRKWYPGKKIIEGLKDDPNDPEDWYLGKNVKEWREGGKDDTELIPGDQQVTGGARVDSQTGQVVDSSGKPKIPPQNTGQRGVPNMPGPSFDTYTAGPGSNPQQTAPGEPGIGSAGVDVNNPIIASETTNGKVAPVAPPGVGGGELPELPSPIPTPPPDDSEYVAPLIQDIGAPKGTGLGTPIEGRPSIVTPERGERIARSTERIERAARGELPLGTPVPAAQRVDPDIEMEATTMETVDDTPDRQAVGTTQDVTTGTVATGRMPDTIAPATYDADEVLEQAAAVGQIGDLSEEATLTDEEIAQAANVDYEATISGADVEIPVGALQQEVTGTISSQSIAEAAKAAGTTGGRLTRAKKQLRKAGLSEEAITELGNDPVALEEKLSDFTEDDRGIIEGLPEEALVSTQLNTLLAGIENGQIPTWASPAVSAVEQMLAVRGLSASSVGRDNLFNAIIQSAVPLAQQNAQAIQASVAQEKSLIAQEEIRNAELKQQVGLDKANKYFQMDMANFSTEVQRQVANSKFMQTIALTETSNDQQATVQNAVLNSQISMQEATATERLLSLNAQNFLKMDLTNVSNEQQAEVLNTQLNQQRLLTNASAVNAAAQFNSTSENQTNQFMSNLTAQMEQYNTSQVNAMEQFNTTQSNAASARDAARLADVSKFNEQLASQIDQFNAKQDFSRKQWNAQNAQIVEASNVEWRRKANTIDTAAQNAVNQQNAQNAFAMSTQAQAFLWQELRDQADFDFRAFENEENRSAQILATAIANEGKAGERYSDSTLSLITSITNSFTGTGGYPSYPTPPRG